MLTFGLHKCTMGKYTHTPPHTHIHTPHTYTQMSVHTHTTYRHTLKTTIIKIAKMYKILKNEFKGVGILYHSFVK